MARFCSQLLQMRNVSGVIGIFGAISGISSSGKSDFEQQASRMVHAVNVVLIFGGVVEEGE